MVFPFVRVNDVALPFVRVNDVVLWYFGVADICRMPSLGSGNTWAWAASSLNQFNECIVQVIKIIVCGNKSKAKHMSGCCQPNVIFAHIAGS